MYEIHADEFPLDQTICRDCKHRMSKIIIPLDPESYGINLEDFDLEEDETVSIETHCCKATGYDMDYIVLSCNKFESVHSIFKDKDPYG